MSYNAKYLTLMAHGAGQRWWSYRTADTPAAVDTAGYFTGEAVAMLKVGDLIFVQQVDNPAAPASVVAAGRSEEHTSELQSLMRISYAVFCLKKKTTNS